MEKWGVYFMIKRLLAKLNEKCVEIFWFTTITLLLLFWGCFIWLIVSLHSQL